MTKKNEITPFEEESVFGTLIRELDDNQKGSINAIKAIKMLNPSYLVSEYTKFFLDTLKQAFASEGGASKAMIKHRAKGMFGEEWAGNCIQHLVSISDYDGTKLFDEHLTILVESHQKRKMIEDLIQLNKKAPNQTLAQSKIEIGQIIDTSSDGSLVASDLGADCDEMLEGRANFVDSGSTKLNQALGGGFQGGQMIVLASRPAMGKTSYSTQLMTNRQIGGHKTLMFTMEMQSKKVLSRMVSQRTRKPLEFIKNIATASNIEKMDFRNDCNLISEDKLSLIYDKANQTIEEIASEVRSKIRQAEVEGSSKPSLIIIDYLGLITTKETVEYVALSYLSREIKKIAMGCSIPILVLAQLNRKLEERALGSQKPKLSDLRGSGAIEQDSDIIMFVHREAVYDENIDRNQPHEALIVMAKNREGATGDVSYTFLPESGVWL